MNYTVLSLLIVKFILAFSSMLLWLRLRNIYAFNILVWWPVSFFISVMAFSAVSMIDNFTALPDLIPLEMLDLWQQGLVIHALLVLLFGGYVMLRVALNHRGLKP